MERVTSYVRCLSGPKNEFGDRKQNGALEGQHKPSLWAMSLVLPKIECIFAAITSCNRTIFFYR